MADRKFRNITYPNGNDGNLCIKAFTTADAYNSLTQDDIQKLADAALTSTGVAGVTVSVDESKLKDTVLSVEQKKLVAGDGKMTRRA